MILCKNIEPIEKFLSKKGVKKICFVQNKLLSKTNFVQRIKVGQKI